MMYPFITLDDETEIVHSEMHEDGTVRVYMEKPVEGGHVLPMRGETQHVV